MSSPPPLPSSPASHAPPPLPVSAPVRSVGTSHVVPPPLAPQGPPVTIIVDGIWASCRRWTPLKQALESRGHPAQLWDYDSSGRVRFEKLAGDLIAHVHSLGRPVNLVGFSMGGLIIRAAHMLDPTIPVRRTAFLNSPHRGSWLAFLLPLPGIIQMNPLSDLMRRVKADPWPVPSLVVWNPWDTMIVPGWNSRWPGATCHMLCPVPIHPWPIWSGICRRRVTEFLTSP